VDDTLQNNQKLLCIFVTKYFNDTIWQYQ
jgi:hypothetical protein